MPEPSLFLAILEAARPEAGRIADALERALEGAAAVSLARQEAGRWRVEAYIPGDDAAAVRERVRAALGGDGFGAEVAVAPLPERDWVAESLAGLRPVEAGRFVVHGNHDRGRVPAGRIGIEIEAAQAFGTGHHGTTSGCLAVLDRLARRRRFARALDLGTGSGVLAIALAKANRAPVLATDIDPLSVEAAGANAYLNGVGNRVRVVEAAGVDHPLVRRAAPFDLVVANILANPLIRLAPRLVPLVARGGVLVLSGLLPRQRSRVTAAYAVQGCAMLRAEVHDGWSVLTLVRRRA